MHPQPWKIGASPFCGDVRPDLFHANPMHNEALARLQYLVDQHRRLGLVLGENGSGKSLLLAVLATKLAAAGKPVVRINLTGLEPEELPWLVAAGLGLNPRDGDSNARLWRKINDHLVENRYLRLGTTLLLDDIDQAPTELVTAVLRLAAQSGHPAVGWLTLILTAEPGNVGRLGKRLLELVDLRIDLEKWDAASVRDFVSASLVKRGAAGLTFDLQAIDRIFELSGGNPRHVAQLADLALVAIAGDERSRVDASTVDAVYEELLGCGIVSDAN